MNKIKKGFTLAEVLITLLIIGIIAAITIPSLLANTNEKIFDAKKHALHVRLAQAIGQFNKLAGYGQITKAAEGTKGEEGYKPAEDNYAESFVLALSKVLKMNNFCTSTNLNSCGITGSITALDGKSTVQLYTVSKTNTLGEINSSLLNSPVSSRGGKDIGFVTVYSNQNSQTVMPLPVNYDLENTYTYEGAIEACQTNSELTRLPDIGELVSLYINKEFLGSSANNAYKSSFNYWSSTAYSAGTSGEAWAISPRADNAVIGWHNSRINKRWVRCIKK